MVFCFLNNFQKNMPDGCKSCYCYIKQYLSHLYAHAPRVQTRCWSRDSRVHAPQTCGRLKHESGHQSKAVLKYTYAL